MAIYHQLQRCPHYRVTVIHACIIHKKLNFRLKFETANQLGFEPGSRGPKAAMLTIELHSIDMPSFPCPQSFWKVEKEQRVKRPFYEMSACDWHAHYFKREKQLTVNDKNVATFQCWQKFVQIRNFFCKSTFKIMFFFLEKKKINLIVKGSIIYNL